MKSIIRDIMANHLTENNFISPSQHGFVAGKACSSNLLESLDIITEALNRGFEAVMVLLEFAKAFDSPA
jgi:hypothetical protein